jgi:hypothetical protein
MYARSGRGSGGRGVGAPELPGPLPAAAPRATRFPPEPTPTCRRPGSSAVRSVTKPKQTATRPPRTRAERIQRHAATPPLRPRPRPRVDVERCRVLPRGNRLQGLRPASPSRRRTRAHLRWTRARSEAKPSEGARPPKKTPGSSLGEALGGYGVRAPGDGDAGNSRSCYTESFRRFGKASERRHLTRRST